MNEHLYAVIMAGGVGSRLWPRSREATPKQFLDLLGPRTLLQATVDRLMPLVPQERILVVTGEEHVNTVREQVPDLPPENLIVEPGPRGTAPCIGLAAVALRLRDEQATMVACPADHVIADGDAFRRAVTAAAHFARQGYLVTLGIHPDSAHTGYGYIQRGDLLGHAQGQAVYRVRRFTEKPDAATARRFVDSGEYDWNGGIFIWRADVILAEMARLLPDLAAELEAVRAAWGTPSFAETLAGAWQRVPRTTIDYGVMERAERVAVTPVEMGWDDVGNWASLSRLAAGPGDGNVVHGGGRFLPVESEGVYVYAPAGRLIAAVGLHDFVIVDTPDALLICPKDQAQAVRRVVAQLKEAGLREYL